MSGLCRDVHIARRVNEKRGWRVSAGVSQVSSGQVLSGRKIPAVTLVLAVPLSWENRWIFRVLIPLFIHAPAGKSGKLTPVLWFENMMFQLSGKILIRKVRQLKSNSLPQGTTKSVPGDVPARTAPVAWGLPMCLWSLAVLVLRVLVGGQLASCPHYLPSLLPCRFWASEDLEPVVEICLFDKVENFRCMAKGMPQAWYS